jgi:hypothetical protein
MTVDGIKLIYTPASRDLSADPTYREKLELLAAELMAMRSEDRLDLGVPQPQRRPTAVELKKLRSLGYVD